MLSYRHAFHAGNHADVLKHLCETLVLDYLTSKAGKPLCYIDTHAGCGEYRLDRGFAQQNAEFQSGIARLWSAPELPAPLQTYMDLVRSFNPDQVLQRYPGSAAIARHLLRQDDRLLLSELHPVDFKLLQQWSRPDRRILCARQDGLERLLPSLPPRERRALVLIDPSYEVKNDYHRAYATLKQAAVRFATGVYLLWYPLLRRVELERLQHRLQALPLRSLTAELTVADSRAAGMVGSGVFVINPPWQLASQLEACRDALPALLGQSPAATLRITTQNLI